MGNVWEWTRNLESDYPYPSRRATRAKREDLQAPGGVSQVIKDKIGDFEIPVDKLLRLGSNDERRQRRNDVVSDTTHLIRQLGMHVLQFCEDNIRVVEVRDATLRYVIKGRQVLMQEADEASCLAGHGRVRQALDHMAWEPGIYPPAPTARITYKRPPI